MVTLNFARYDDAPAVIARDEWRDEWRQKTIDEAISRIELAKPLTEIERNRVVVERQKARQCPSHYIHGACDNGHHYAKELNCGLEWCPVCGQKDSNAHKRRFASFVDKARRTKHLALMVIELPLSSRNKWRYRRSLESVGKIVTSVINGNYEVQRLRSQGVMLRAGEVAEIKAKYPSRGMRRYHYFGDVKAELDQLRLNFETISDDSGEDLPETTVKSNIHLNLLLDSAFIPKPFLKHIVYLLREALGEPKLIVNYGYTRDIGRMVHMVKYTTRATFRDITWDEWLAGQLYGFRNMRSWGVWKDDYAWSLDDLPDEALKEVEGVNYDAIKSLGESICYKDMLPIKWSSPRPIFELANMPIKQDLGAGYYELQAFNVPEFRISEGEVMFARRQKALEESKRIREHDNEQIELEACYYGDILLQYDADLEAELKRVNEFIGEQNHLLPVLHKTLKGRGDYASADNTPHSVDRLQFDEYSPRCEDI